jgi:hypothetical protein
LHKPRRTFPETYVNAAGKTVPMEVSIPVSAVEDIIQQELKCPICLGTIQGTSTVTACLHRFCSDCLHKSLRGNLNGSKQNHDCPSCRFKLPSKRSTRPDGDFDGIIRVLTTAMDKYRSANPTPSPRKAAAAPDVRPVRQASQQSRDEDDDRPFDIRQFQRSHSAAVAAFREKQKEKMKEVRQQIAKYQAKAANPPPPPGSRPSLLASVARTAGVASSSSAAQSSRTSHSKSQLGAQPAHPPASSAPEVLRVNVALFPFVSAAVHIAELAPLASSAAEGEPTGAPAAPATEASESNEPGAEEAADEAVPAVGAKRPRSPTGESPGPDAKAARPTPVDDHWAGEPLPPLALPYLRIPETLTVQVLKEYVAARLSLAADELRRLEIVSVDAERLQALPADQSLLQVVQTAWRGSGRFFLYYRLAAPAVAAAIASQAADAAAAADVAETTTDDAAARQDDDEGAKPPDAATAMDVDAPTTAATTQ